MPLFMDVHRNVKGSPDDVAAAHQKDLEIQKRHQVEYLKYWHDPNQGTIFCLAKAPSREAAEAVHREAHGLMPDEIHEVSEG